MVCLGSDNVERSYQPRRVTLPIVPDYVKEPIKKPGLVFDSNERENQIRFRFSQLNTLQTVVLIVTKRIYGQAARVISTSKLNASLRFHTWPINLVVYQDPLGGLCLGRSHLVEGFTLRCLQRFSLPNVATRHCHWRDNRYTRGSSNPVLSY